MLAASGVAAPGVDMLCFTLLYCNLVALLPLNRKDQYRPNHPRVVQMPSWPKPEHPYQMSSFCAVHKGRHSGAARISVFACSCRPLTPPPCVSAPASATPRTTPTPPPALPPPPG